MKKLYVAAAVLVIPLFLASGAWALTVDDQQGVSGAYYGGIDTTAAGSNPSYAFDTIPATSTQFSVTRLTATNVAGGYIQATFIGPYFSTQYANPADTTVPGKPGDLYISSTGWVVDTNPANHGIGDAFNMTTEHWNEVVPFGGSTIGVNDGIVFTYTNTMHNLVAGYTPTSSQAVFTEWRTGQAWNGGYGATNLGTVYSILNTDAVARTTLAFTVPADSLTFIFPDQGLNADALGYHWTQGCGNDVVEGGGTPVPEPASLLLLGLGLAGFGVCRHKAAGD